MDSKTRNHVLAKLLGKTSCIGCAYLYFKDEGYSNYTVEETRARCAINRNPHFSGPGLEVPHDWTFRVGVSTLCSTLEKVCDNWPATQYSRCEEYLPLPEHPESRLVRHIRLQVENYDPTIEEYLADQVGIGRLQEKTAATILEHHRSLDGTTHPDGATA